MALSAASPAKTTARDTVPVEEEHTRDVRLMLAVAGGDREAFRELFRHHYAGVVHFCFRIVHDRAVAEELAQETFFRLHRARERYRPRARFRTYVLTIAQRLCLNELRRPYRRATTPLSLEADGPGAGGERGRLEVADRKGVNPERQAGDRERLDQVVRVLEEMPARQRTATVLHRFEARSYEEIAEMMGCSTRAVKSLLNRSRKLIVRRLGS